MSLRKFHSTTHSNSHNLAVSHVCELSCLKSYAMRHHIPPPPPTSDQPLTQHNGNYYAKRLLTPLPTWDFHAKSSHTHSHNIPTPKKIPDPLLFGTISLVPFLASDVWMCLDLFAPMYPSVSFFVRSKYRISFYYYGTTVSTCVTTPSVQKKLCPFDALQSDNIIHILANAFC